MRARQSPARQQTSGQAWAPRLAQEARLRELDARLARSETADEAINLEIERAALLGALNRRQDAQQAFVAVLRKAPTHFSALNEFGTLLAATGAIEAACRVYAEAILHHPDNPLARVNLANLLLRTARYREAREHYERALQADPGHAEAHQGLGAVLSDLGDRAGAREHFKKGFLGRAVSTLPYRGDKPPIPLLQLVSSGGGNIPCALFLDDTQFLTSVVVTDHYDASTPLPPHSLIFNAIGDADLCGPALAAAIELVAGVKVPVINHPAAVTTTGRIANAQRLHGIEGVRTAHTKAVAREVLTNADGARSLAGCGFSFPLLLRSPGYHTGRNFVLVEGAADLPAAAAQLPGEELLAIEYLDARGSDGNARKFRVMMIDGKLHPLHLAISQHWKVHYFTSDMADQPTHRAEEAKFLEDMPAVLGAKAMRALTAIQAALGLDYAGVDFGLSPDGDVLMFEANATMVIAKPNDDAHWAYRRNAIDGAVEAVVAMLKREAAASPRHRR
ncbi:MAG: tetratricopeptide repeat protein [Bradyrhizobium sp.]|nr:tetratricopeptide repeat protein [Bradyrhizobium sp.]